MPLLTVVFLSGGCAGRNGAECRDPYGLFFEGETDWRDGKVAVDEMTDADIEALNKKQNRAQEVEERLKAPGKDKGQSLKSNLVGNSADLNSKENYPPDKSGAQSVTPLTAKIDKNSKHQKIWRKECRILLIMRKR